MIEVVLTCLSLIAVDGDTVKCDRDNMRLLGEGVPYSSGIDTPELGKRARCDTERRLALEAKRILNQWLDTNSVKVLYSGSDDSFGRPLVNIYLENGEEVGQKLLKQGYAKTWHRGKKINWCN